MGWLQEHMENFVKPYIGFIPQDAYPYFSAEELTVIKNAWRSAKAACGEKKMLLAGRDVFIFEILARREGYPTIFIPECSRSAVRAINLENKEELFLFDTGFVGTIPKVLGLQRFSLLSYSANKFDQTKQIFPHLTMSRHLALKIESSPKYWETGRAQDGRVIQNFSQKGEFENAARLTLAIYTNSAPKFINKRKVLTQTGGLYAKTSFGF